MIGQVISDKDGNPLDNNGNKLAESSYQPSREVKDLFAKVQRDYQVAYTLQHRTFEEFDGYSLLQRVRLDQQTFGAFVGCEFVPQHKKWRWKGRKNTARNKLLGILAHLIAGMLYPFVNAQNDENESDALTARVMRILVEEHLKKAGYELKFLYMVLSALVNPAVIVEIPYVVAFQVIKQRLKSGEIKVTQAVDEMLSGLQLYIRPIDEVLLADFYTNNIQLQPYVLSVRRIPWDTARKIYAGKHFDKDGVDQFDYVEAGQTKVLLTGQENQTLYDVDWTEADRNYVQEITAYYRDEDLEVVWVGGVFMGEAEDVFNANPFTHRRMSLLGNEWMSIPVYPFAKSGFEPLDPTGRFAYFKSGAFKEYWDDKLLNELHGMGMDAIKLETIKPLFISGVAKVDSIVIAPGAVTGMPQGAAVAPWSMSPNLPMTLQAMQKQDEDMSKSTQDDVMNGVTNPNVTATQTNLAAQQAKVFLGNFGVMVADLLKQVGELTMDCIIQNTTVGEIDATIPEALRMKFKTVLAHGKEGGKSVTNKILFTDEFMGVDMTEDDKRNANWKIFNENGGEKTDNFVYKVNPYKFARTMYSIFIDVDKILMKSMGADAQQKQLAFQMMTDPRVMPYTDQQAVIDDFVIEEYGGDDPDKYKKKDNGMLDQMGMMAGGGAGQPPQGGMVVPQQPQMAGAMR